MTLTVSLAIASKLLFTGTGISANMDSLLDNLLKIFFANSTKKIWELSITGTYRKATAATGTDLVVPLLHFAIGIDNLQLLSMLSENSLENFKVNYRELGLCRRLFSCNRIWMVADLMLAKVLV